MKLFVSPTSPFARKTLVVLHEANALDQVYRVDVGGSPIESGTIPTNLNPLGKIPVLELDDGQVIYDSNVICDFFLERFSCHLQVHSSLIWEVKTLEALADGIMEAAVLVVYENRFRPADLQFSAWIDGQMRKIKRSLDRLDTVAEDWGSVLHGAPVLAQFSVAIALGYLDYRLADFNWRWDRPHLTAWAADMAKRPSLIATTPPKPQSSG